MWTKVRAVAAGVWADLKDTYQRTKIFLLGILALVAYIEWNKIKTAWLVKSGQNEIKSDNKKDASLAKAETSDSSEADALIEDAKELPNTEQTVADDWNTK